MEGGLEKRRRSLASNTGTLRLFERGGAPFSGGTGSLSQNYFNYHMVGGMYSSELEKESKSLLISVSDE